MSESLSRVFLVARHTWLEAWQHRVLWVLGLFGLVCAGGGQLLAGLSIEEQLKFIQDVVFGAMGVFGVLLAILLGAQLVHGEEESRTLHTTLAKPVRRGEWLWGKFVGVLAVVQVMVVVMAVVGGVVFLMTTQGKEPDAGVSLGRAPGKVGVEAGGVGERTGEVWVQAGLLVAAKVTVTLGLTVLISRVASSSLFTVLVSLFVYVIGHIQSTAREVWLVGSGGGEWWQVGLCGVLAVVVPEMRVFDVMEEVLAGRVVGWGHTLAVCGYAVAYSVAALAVAQLLFVRREL